jgi:pyruvate dehydrogenase E1 component
MADDLDPLETREWLDSLDAVLEFDGPQRAAFLLDELIGEAGRNGAAVPYSANTPYLNTIPPHREPRYPGDQEIEHALRAMIRWNAVAIVLRANKESSELGGHIASFQSAATLYDIGFITSGAPRRPVMAATWSTCRVTPRPASTRGRSAKAG